MTDKKSVEKRWEQHDFTRTIDVCQVGNYLNAKAFQAEKKLDCIASKSTPNKMTYDNLHKIREWESETPFWEQKNINANAHHLPCCVKEMGFNGNSKSRSISQCRTSRSLLRWQYYEWMRSWRTRSYNVYYTIRNVMRNGDLYKITFWQPCSTLRRWR